MNLKIILKSLGILLICEAGSMLLSLLVSIIYAEPSFIYFIYSIIIITIIGLPLIFINTQNTIFYAKDGFAIVSLGWILVSLFGALPFFLSGYIPSLVNSIFETISGFTTTGASILVNIESLPKGILFWRSFTHWIGGMGVLMLTLAILPSAGAKSFHIMKAESPGPSPEKLVPKIRHTARILYEIYFAISLAEVIALLVAGMPLYDSFIHTFGTAGTGGFSNRNSSVGAYANPVIDVIVTVFMLVFGTNFALHYHLLRGNVNSFLKNEEFRLYIGIAIFSTLFITFNIHGTIYNAIFDSIRYASFQVASIMTTTGFVTADFNMWPVFSKLLLLFLMFIGSCSGSTGGAMKNIRILLLFKVIKNYIIRIIHPRAIHTVKLDGKAVNDEIISGVLVFFFAYIIIFVGSVMIVSINGKDITTTLSSVAATIGNIGPGLGMVGATGNYAHYSILSKIVLSICMIVGRLEIFPMLLLIIPSFWKKVNI
jgi:trk system potassium uptake protein